MIYARRRPRIFRANIQKIEMPPRKKNTLAYCKAHSDHEDQGQNAPSYSVLGLSLHLTFEP